MLTGDMGFLRVFSGGLDREKKMASVLELRG
jgi:hypothetical protein